MTKLDTLTVGRKNQITITVDTHPINLLNQINTLSKITTCTNIHNGVKGVGLVVEAATENIDLKLNSKLPFQIRTKCN